MSPQSRDYYMPSVSTQLERRFLQVSEKVKERYRCLYQHKFSSPETSVLGAFHGTNTGDNTLGASILKITKEADATADFQNLYTLPKWYSSRKAICAGGATGVESNLKMLAERYKNNPHKVALVGMDFSADFSQFSSEILSFLSSVAFISCRSKQQQAYVAKVLTRGDVRFHFDNAFSYLSASENLVSSSIDIVSQAPKMIGFNSLNFFMTWVRGKGFSPGTPLSDWYKKRNSNLSNYIDVLGLQYVKFLRKVLDIYSSRGWSIIHIPFTPEDHLFSKTFFGDKNIIFKTFSPDPLKTLAHFQRCDLFLSTRYHSLIFALASRTPCITFNYATKCTDLIEDLGLGSNGSIERLEIMENLDEMVEKTAGPVAYTLDKDIIDSISKDTSYNIQSAVELL